MENSENNEPRLVRVKSNFKDEVKKPKVKYKSHVRHPEAFKRKIVREVEMGLTPKEAVLKYGLTDKALISIWRKKYSSEIASIIVAPMSPEEEKELMALKKRNEELIKNLQEASMKILGLETLIDVAEQELKVEIRKKSGSKQSND